MNALLLYPEFPDTFWSFKHAVGFVGKRAAFPPLGLMTVAGMLPSTWNLRLVDANVRNVRECDLAWADIALISGMVVQKDSARALIARCKQAHLTVVAGGPLFTTDHAEFADVDHFVLNEAELTLPGFLADLAAGHARRLYETADYADMACTPCPRWDLVDARRYANMAIQYSRGCPFNCEFCNITSMLGRKVRVKSADQVLVELDGLYASGWRGNVFFVDDNFIGNRSVLKNEFLPRLIAWRETRRCITFQTEASINLADDDELMAMMVQAGFNAVFIGVETPDESSLAECSKKQNLGRDLLEGVKIIQRAGMQVQGGFIVGFDSDTPSVFQRQIKFIQASGIVTAMVGILQAPAGTRLHLRMQQEGRLRGPWTGDNGEGLTNIIPRMDLDRLRRGYHDILRHIYAPRHYYKRIRTFLREYRPPRSPFSVSRSQLMAFLRSLYRLGIFGRERVEYWKLVIWTFARRPSQLPLAVTLAIYGYHYRKVAEQHVQ